MISWAKEKKALIFLAIGIVIIALLPVFQVALLAGNDWRGVIPGYVDDDIYYYARLKEVADGHPLIGNPYFIEHNNTITPAFFVTDWLTAMPLIIGIPFVPAVIANFLFWSLVFGIGLYILARSMAVGIKFSILLSVTCYLSVYWQMIRPTAMQIIFPIFLFFVLSFWRWINDSTKSTRIGFIIFSVVGIYAYTYLAQVILITFVFTAVYFISNRDRARLDDLARVFARVILLSIPAAIYTILQIGDTNYWETIMRLGLVTTYLPTIYMYYYGRWLVVALLVGILFVRKSALAGDRISGMFISIVSASLLVLDYSNVLTGKELENGQHVGRFEVFWLPVVIVFALSKLYTDWNNVTFEKRTRYCLVALVLIGSLGIVSNFPRSIALDKINGADVRSIQKFSGPLGWLEKNESAPSVIFADDRLSSYVPIMTRHYVLFHPAGGLQLMSTQELTERYLISRSYDNLSTDDLLSDYRIYEGAGAVHRYEDAYNKNKWCVKMSRIFLTGKCGENVGSLADYVGKDYFGNLAHKYSSVVGSLSYLLNRYNVAYIVKDSTVDFDWHPEDINGAAMVYSDGRFEIYKLKQ